MALGNPPSLFIHCEKKISLTLRNGLQWYFFFLQWYLKVIMWHRAQLLHLNKQQVAAIKHLPTEFRSLASAARLSSFRDTFSYSPKYKANVS